MDVGSSYLASELVAAFLWAQLEEADSITKRRINIWSMYHQCLYTLESDGLCRRPIVPECCTHNAHMYYVLLPDLTSRTRFIDTLKASGIQVVFHYVPLHNSPAGLRFSRSQGELSVTDDISGRLVRLPLWLGIEDYQAKIIGEVITAFAA